MLSRLISAYQSISLGVRILVGLVVGGLIGFVVGEPAVVFAPLGDLFINLLMMAAIPLVFFNVVAAVTGLSSVKTLGKMGASTLLFYVGTTAVALICGLFMGSLVRPGEGVSFSDTPPENLGEAPGLADVLLGLVPSNVVQAFATGNVAQVVVFGVLLGVAGLSLEEKKRQQLHGAVDLIADCLRKLINIVLEFGPLGIAALAAETVGEHGRSVVGPLGKFVLSVWAAQAVMVFVYLGALYAFTKRNPLAWLRQTSSLYATTSATCSSLASLAVSMDIARDQLRLPERVYGFTLPIGAQLNKDGTSIMLAIVLLFTAQAEGVEFGIASLIQILLIGLVLSEGSTGIPGGGLVIAFIFVEAFNLPPAAAAMVAGVYRLVDMGSTTINCMGDMAWTTIASDLFDRGSSQAAPSAEHNAPDGVWSKNSADAKRLDL